MTRKEKIKLYNQLHYELYGKKNNTERQRKYRAKRKKMHPVQSSLHN